MTQIDLDRLTPGGLIAQYVLECRGEGHVLPYADYEVIADWLAAASDPDQLLVVLSDVLPAFFDPTARTTAKPRSLRSLRRRVLKKLKEAAAVRSGVIVNDD